MTRLSKKALSIVLLTIFTLIFTNNLNAQRLIFVFGHGLYANPVDKNFDNNYRFGLGLEGGAGVGLKNTFIVGTAAFTQFKSENSNDSGSVTVIPFKAGVRQYLVGKLVYLHGDVGIASVNYRDGESAKSRLTAGIGAGFKLAGFEVQLDYDGFSRDTPSGYASWIGIKAGFTISL